MARLATLLIFALALSTAPVLAAETGALDLTHHWAGLAAVAVFGLAYLLVMLEDVLELRKSKPVMIAAGLIWLFLGIVYRGHGRSDIAEAALRHNLLEFAELLLFLLAAMTYVNTMEERRIFEALRARLVRFNLTYRGLFWATGALAFLLSTLAANLTVALVMGTLIMAVGKASPRFVSLACINVVVASNAGGVFTPFGDITSLMIWQAGKLGFFDFLTLTVPALVNFLVPALIMGLAVPAGTPGADAEHARMKPGAKAVMALFGVTILMAVGFRSLLGLPPVFGMMLGLGLLQSYSYFLGRSAKARGNLGIAFDPNSQTARAEWDTLFFFFGVILCVGGLTLAGYISGLAAMLYGGLGPTGANIVIGALSAILDNIPILYAVLNADPPMGLSQWLLVALTTGVGGSLLSIGSAAGVALMGTARGHYTFLAHLRWSWAIALGYVAAIVTHLALTD
jgi:Na+/H+ antiporter NhaD/arsenite permease-like protein